MRQTTEDKESIGHFDLDIDYTDNIVVIQPTQRGAGKINNITKTPSKIGLKVNTEKNKRNETECQVNRTYHN